MIISMGANCHHLSSSPRTATFLWQINCGARRSKFKAGKFKKDGSRIRGALSTTFTRLTTSSSSDFGTSKASNTSAVGPEADDPRHAGTPHSNAQSGQRWCTKPQMTQMFADFEMNSSASIGAICGKLRSGQKSSLISAREASIYAYTPLPGARSLTSRKPSAISRQPSAVRKGATRPRSRVRKTSHGFRWDSVRGATANQR